MGKFLVSLKRLEDWFAEHTSTWRDHPSIYRVWISEIMLQQTQVTTVIPYFERFISGFPTLEALAQASVEDVLLYWSGLGYYSRARNLHRGAQTMVGEAGFLQSGGMAGNSWGGGVYGWGYFPLLAICLRQFWMEMWEESFPGSEPFDVP